MTFDELKLAPAILKAVREQGYETPTPIQAQAIPAVLEGHDLLAGAQTGTGKTAAFTLPLLHRMSMMRSATNRAGNRGIRALVLTPTRELAAQVEESVRTYGQYLQLNSTVIFGGVGQNPQIERLQRGVDILVATPGRLLDLAEQGHLDLSTVQFLVLDEADRMLDMGFIHDVKKVLALLPKDKQSLLFSATFSDEIRDLAHGLLREPRSIQVTPRNTTVQRIEQVIHPVGRGKKKALLAHVIREHDWSQVLVFTRTKFGANQVADYLNANGVTAMALHGNKSQSARTQALDGFKSGDIRALVATDIAARGIDIEDLPHVVNYDIPNVPEDYVHRIGRTGRAGASGQAVSLVSLDEEGFMEEIERFTSQQIPVQPVEGFGPEEGEVAEPIAMGRQTLWGGKGRPPGRDVMMAAAKAARREMLDRVRDNRARQGGGKPQRPANARSPMRPGQPSQQGQQPPMPSEANPDAHEDDDDYQPRHVSHDGQRARGPGGGQGRGFNRNKGFGGGPRGGGFGGNGGGGGQPDPLRTNTIRDLTRGKPRPQSGTGGGQPDPTRTSIDFMADRAGGKRRHGGGGGGNGGGGGGYRGGVGKAANGKFPSGGFKR